MARNKFFEITQAEQDTLEDLILQSLDIYAQEFYYIPRILVAKDEILGEDRLSKFQDIYSIDAYIENVEGFEGQGAFIQKFGLQIEQSATLVVARRTWRDLVGDDGTTILPNRPCEGDLMYFPLSKGLIEIKYVEDKNPFFQLNKLYTYKLSVEIFQYSSEEINTGIEEVDIFESLKTFDIDQQDDIDVPDSYGDNNTFDEEAAHIVVGDGVKI